MKENMKEDERFIIRTYEKAELAHLYNPNMPLVSAMRKLRAWIRRNRQLTDALTATGENKRDHSYTPRQVSLIVAVLGEPETSLFDKNRHIKLKQFMKQQVKQSTRYLPAIYRQN